MDGYLDQQVPYTLANVRMDVNFQCFFCFVCVLLSPPVRFYVSLCVCFGESASRPARVFVPKQPQQQQQQKQQLCARYRKKKILHNFTQICNKVQQSNAFGDVCERGLFCGTVWLNVRQMVTFFRRKKKTKTARLCVFFFLFFLVSFNRNASAAERCVVVAAADSCEAL